MTDTLAIEANVLRCGYDVGFFSLLHQAQRMSTETAIRALLLLAIDTPDITAEQQLHIYSLDDGYDLAVEGIHGSLREVEHDLHKFLSPYAEKLRTRFPHLVPCGE